jgi:hypothetical protein
MLLCIALHLYSGPIESGTPVTVVSHECKKASASKIRSAVAKCAREGAEKCEVIVDKPKGQIVLEHKVSTKGSE